MTYQRFSEIAFDPGFHVSDYLLFNVDGTSDIDLERTVGKKRHALKIILNVKNVWIDNYFNFNFIRQHARRR